MPQNTRRYFEELLQSSKGTSPDSPEFEDRVRAKIGKRFENEIADKKGLLSLVGDPQQYYPLYGVNFPKVRPKDYIEKKLKEEVGTDVSVPDKARIFGLGAGASPTVWAHELRHEKVKDELDNRLYDLMYSTSPQNYAANLLNTYEWMVGNTELIDNPYANKTFKQMEKEVLKRLNPITGAANLNAATEYWRSQPEVKSGASSEEQAKSYANKKTKANEISVNWDRHFGINADPTRRSRDLLARKVNDEKLQDQINQLLNERAALPFLNFVGSPDLADLVIGTPLPYGRKILKEGAPKKKAAGGDVENTTHDRKLI